MPAFDILRWLQVSDCEFMPLSSLLFCVLLVFHFRNSSLIVHSCTAYNLAVGYAEIGTHGLLWITATGAKISKDYAVWEIHR